MRFRRYSVLLLAVWSPCFARELVYLNSGFTLEVESHSQENRTLVCKTSTGTLELQMSDVARIEPLPELVGAAIVAAKSAAPTADEVLTKAALDQGLPPELIRSVAKIESGMKQNAVSVKGAMGLMQLMPATAATLGVKPMLAEENAQGGAKYLRDLLLRYHDDSALALAAYNAGPGAVDKYGAVPPYAETRQYVLKVLREYERQHKLHANGSAGSASQRP
jgi:soluble lytic murein transglycosylase-like protein